MSLTSELNGLIELIRRRGFAVRREGSRYRIYYPDNRPVLVQTRPVTISTNPQNAHWRANTIRELVRAGVLERDPYSNYTEPKVREQEVERKVEVAVKRGQDSNFDNRKRWREAFAPLLPRLQALIVQAGDRT